MLIVPGADGCDFLVDDVSDEKFVNPQGQECEGKYAKDGSLPDHSNPDSGVFKCILLLVQKSFPADKAEDLRMALTCKGVSGVTTTGVH